MPKTHRTRSLRRAVAAIALVASVAVGLQATGAVSPVRAQGQAVSIEDFAFTPPNGTITAGGVVTWTNAGGQQHTVTSDAGGTLDSGPIGPGEAFGYVFDTPGTYTYHCAFHTAMKGTITVTAAAATPVPSGSPAPTAVPSGSPAPTAPAGSPPPGVESPSPSAEPVASSAPPSVASAEPSVASAEPSVASAEPSVASPAPAATPLPTETTGGRAQPIVLVIIWAVAIGLIAAIWIRYRRQTPTP